MKLMIDVRCTEDGSAVTITFGDGSTEVREADMEGYLDLRDLRFRDARTGEVTQWGDDGAYQLTDGFVANL